MDRIALLHYLLGRFGCKSYLEIGCRDDSCFGKIIVDKKIGVDPESGGNFRNTSDNFFMRNHRPWRRYYFDLVFIDGLHWSEQVYRDIENSLKWLKPGGTIVLHDCNPKSELEAAWPYSGSSDWNGDVWKAIAHFRQDPNLDMVVADFDHGCGIIRVRKNTDPIKLPKPYTELTWQDLETNRQKWLRLTPFEEVIKWL